MGSINYRYIIYYISCRNAYFIVNQIGFFDSGGWAVKACFFVTYTNSTIIVTLHKRYNRSRSFIHIYIYNENWRDHNQTLHELHNSSRRSLFYFLQITPKRHLHTIPRTVFSLLVIYTVASRTSKLDPQFQPKIDAVMAENHAAASLEEVNGACPDTI